VTVAGPAQPAAARRREARASGEYEFPKPQNSLICIGIQSDDGFRGETLALRVAGGYFNR
jgi:hypothetical protein